MVAAHLDIVARGNSTSLPPSGQTKMPQFGRLALGDEAHQLNLRHLASQASLPLRQATTPLERLTGFGPSRASKYRTKLGVTSVQELAGLSTNEATIRQLGLALFDTRRPSKEEVSTIRDAIQQARTHVTRSNPSKRQRYEDDWSALDRGGRENGPSAGGSNQGGGAQGK